jgi:hypothetical protein
MEKLSHHYFYWTVASKKKKGDIYRREATRGDKTIRSKLLHHSDLRKGGGGRVFLGEISSSTRYSKKDYKEKKKKQHSYKIGTWNVRTLNRGGKLGNLKNKYKGKRCLFYVSVKYNGKDKVKEKVVIILYIIPEVNGLKNVWQ